MIHNMAKASFQIDDEAQVWVENRLVPGQSRSSWYRYAVETTMNLDAFLDGLYEPYQFDERQQFIEAAVYEKVQSDLEDAINNGHESRMEAMLGPDWEKILDKYGVEMPEE